MFRFFYVSCFVRLAVNDWGGGWTIKSLYLKEMIVVFERRGRVVLCLCMRAHVDDVMMMMYRIGNEKG